MFYFNSFISESHMLRIVTFHEYMSHAYSIIRQIGLICFLIILVSGYVRKIGFGEFRNLGCDVCAIIFFKKLPNFLPVFLFLKVDKKRIQQQQQQQKHNFVFIL